VLLRGLAAVGFLLLSACASAPAATVVSQVPEPIALPAKLETYDLAPGAIAVEADVSAGSSYTLRFTRSSGKLVLAPDKVEASQIEVFVDTTNVESSIQLVADIAKDQFLHTYQHPSARFTSRALRKATSGGLELWGDLDFHGTKKSLVVPATIEVDACWIKLACEFAIDRRTFGAVSDGSLDGVVSDEVTIRFEADIRREGAAEGCGEKRE